METRPLPTDPPLPFRLRDRSKPDLDGNKFDEDAAQRALDFIQGFCHHVKGEWAGRLFILGDWEWWFVTELFGWLTPEGTRQYRTVYLSVARKNGKSTLGAAIGLYLTLADNEYGAEVYSAAADRFQAAIVFDIARTMVGLDEYLTSRTETFRRAVIFKAHSSSYQVLSADAPGKHGLNGSGIIFDELHAQPNRDLYDVLKTSTGARRQPVQLNLTTAGYDKESICYEVYQYAKKVAAGVVQDPSFLAVIYEADETDDWESVDTWHKANPNLEESVKLDYLLQEYNRAKEIPAYQNTFRRLHLNQWTEQATRWLDVATWDACAAEIDLAALEGQPCYGGLDLASTTDLAALALFFPTVENTVLLRFWIPEDSAKIRTRRDRIRYDEWVRQGWIEATPGNVIDYDVIRQRINELGKVYRIRELGIDPWNAQAIETQLTGDGFILVPIRQGFASMTAPTKHLEKLLLERNIRHDGNPVLRWNASNVSVKSDPAGNLKPDKATSTEKIDGIVALIIALARAIVQKRHSSVYAERGLITL
jgi:phage terminase large subunit-like protein